MESGFVWAPYIPVIKPIAFDYTQDLSTTKGILTRYAKKLINPSYYGKITFPEITNPCAEILIEAELVPKATGPAFIADPAMYPHVCTRCGAPAYVGFMKVDCSRKSCC